MSQPAALMAWNMFQKANKGQGKSQKELAAMFKMQRSMAPVLLSSKPKSKPKVVKMDAKPAAPEKRKRRKCLQYAE